MGDLQDKRLEILHGMQRRRADAGAPVQGQGAAGGSSSVVEGGPSWAGTQPAAGSGGGTPPLPEEATGVENVRYDVVTAKGAPSNPRSVREMMDAGPARDAEAEAPAQGQKPADAGGGTPPLPEEERERAEALKGLDRQIRTAQDWLDSVDKPESAEDRKKRERQERSRRIIAAVSDGLSALGNLYYTTQYAPNMYDHGKMSQTAAADRRIERLRADRDKRHDRYLNLSLKLGDLYNQRAATLRGLAEQQERRKQARKKEDHDDTRFDFEQSTWADQAAEQQAKRRKAEADAVTAQAVADAAPEMQRKKAATEDARASSYRAAAARQGREGYYGTFMGRRYETMADYTKAVYEEARKYNDRKGKDVVPVEWYKGDNYNDSIPTLYEAYDVAAQLEPLLIRERAAKQPIKGSMPGVKDHGTMPGVKLK